VGASTLRWVAATGAIYRSQVALESTAFGDRIGFSKSEGTVPCPFPSTVAPALDTHCFSLSELSMMRSLSPHLRVFRQFPRQAHFSVPGCQAYPGCSFLSDQWAFTDADQQFLQVSKVLFSKLGAPFALDCSQAFNDPGPCRMAAPGKAHNPRAAFG
jgi:hypothetical protein